MSDAPGIDKHLDPPCPVVCPECGAEVHPLLEPGQCECFYRECVSCGKRIHINEIDKIGRCDDCKAGGFQKCQRCGLWRCRAEFGAANCLDCEF